MPVIRDRSRRLLLLLHFDFVIEQCKGMGKKKASSDLKREKLDTELEEEEPIEEVELELWQKVDFETLLH